MKTVIQDTKVCYLCGTTLNLEDHHCLNGSDRKKCEEDGLKVWLCANCNRIAPYSAHRSIETRIRLKRVAQAKYLETHTQAEWFRRYYKNYL